MDTARWCPLRALGVYPIDDRADIWVRPPQLVRVTHGAPSSRTVAPGRTTGSSLVPTIAGHGSHLDPGGGEELADLGGVLDDVQREAADDHAVQHAVVSMGARERPRRRRPR